MNDVLKILAQEGVLDNKAIAKVEEDVSNGGVLEESLRGVVPEDKWMPILASHYEIPYVDLNTFEAPKDFFAKFPTRVLNDQKLLPMGEHDGVVSIATSRLFDTSGIDELRVATGMDFRPVLASSIEIERAMKRLIGIGADTIQEMGKEGTVNILSTGGHEDENVNLEAAEDATIIRFVNQVLTEALESRATDVHVEGHDEPGGR